LDLLNRLLRIKASPLKFSNNDLERARIFDEQTVRALNSGSNVLEVLIDFDNESSLPNGPLIFEFTTLLLTPLTNP
jgi:hypothetical protein